MSTKAKIAAIVAGVVVVAGAVAFFVFETSPADVLDDGWNFINPERNCPLTGEEPSSEKLIDRPAVAVKVENNPVAYPLSGLERADIVYEELVEGGQTRFMAIYHCGDAAKVGPVRSARIVDPAIMSPITRILAAAGGNQIVLNRLKKEDIITIDEDDAGDAMRRVERAGLTLEHTLYGDTTALRRLGEKRFDDAPSDELFEFGELEGRSKRARTVTIRFSGATEVVYKWSGGAWQRYDDGRLFEAESGKRLRVDNVLVEEHNVELSKGIVDPAGNPSVEIADVTGSGRAVLFRDGRAVVGRWTRKSRDEPVRFVTKEGDAMVLAPGVTWVELVPSDKGEVKGSFSF